MCKVALGTYNKKGVVGRYNLLQNNKITLIEGSLTAH